MKIGKFQLLHLSRLIASLHAYSGTEEAPKQVDKGDKCQYFIPTAIALKYHYYAKIQAWSLPPPVRMIEYLTLQQF